MKLFAVYCLVDLVNKPDWLDEYRRKYDKPYDFHVTLKQPCYIEESQIPSLKEKLLTFFNKPNFNGSKIKLNFNQVILDDENPNDGCVMIRAEDERINKLQRQILDELQGFNEYYESDMKEWEENFKPHITVARGLNSEKLILASSDLPQNYSFEGLIEKVELSIIDSKDADNASAQKDTTIYNL